MKTLRIFLMYPLIYLKNYFCKKDMFNLLNNKNMQSNKIKYFKEKFNKSKKIKITVEFILNG